MCVVVVKQFYNSKTPHVQIINCGWWVSRKNANLILLYVPDNVNVNGFIGKGVMTGWWYVTPWSNFPHTLMSNRSEVWKQKIYKNHDIDCQNKWKNIKLYFNIYKTG